MASNSEAGFSPEYSLAWLIMNSPQWVHRRVEALRMGESGRSRWHISHDLTVPKQFCIPGSKDRMIVPLGSVRKTALRNVDTSGAGASSLSLLGKEENGNYAVAMLLMLAESLFGSKVAAAPESRRIITNVVHANERTQLLAIKEFRAWCAGNATNIDPDKMSKGFDKSLDFFTGFVGQFAGTFLLMVEIDSKLAGTRCVIKYSRDDIAPEHRGNKSRQTAWEIPDYGFARSYHLEVEVPPGLVYQELEMIEFDSKGKPARTIVDAPPHPQVVAHLACEPSERMSTAVAGLTLAPSLQGQYRVARSSAWITFGVALIAWFSALLPGVLVSETAGPVSAAVSLLLTGPALLLSWFSRSPEHEVVAWIMRPYRNMILLSVTTLLLLAAAAALPLVPVVQDLVWLPVLALQTWALCLSISHSIK